MWLETVHKNSLENVSPDPVQVTQPGLDGEEITAESLCTDETALETPEENG